MIHLISSFYLLSLNGELSNYAEEKLLCVANYRLLFFSTLKQLAYGKVKTETEIGWVTSTSDVKEVTPIKKM